MALVNVAQADAAIAIWESKYVYEFWRPVTGIREADPGTGPTGKGDGNPATVGDPTFSPLGAPASNLDELNFTPPFPAYPSGHACLGGALFQILRHFYQTDDIAFTFVSDELNGVTRDNEGNVRPRLPRSFASLSEAETENGQSRIYLGIHWAFDKAAGDRPGSACGRCRLHAGVRAAALIHRPARPCGTPDEPQRQRERRTPRNTPRGEAGAGRRRQGRATPGGSLRPSRRRAALRRLGQEAYAGQGAQDAGERTGMRLRSLGEPRARWRPLREQRRATHGPRLRAPAPGPRREKRPRWCCAVSVRPRSVSPSQGLCLLTSVALLNRVAQG